MAVLPDVDILIVDVHLDQAGAAYEVPGRWPSVPRLLISDTADGRAAIHALRQGARGILTKDATVEQLVYAIDGICAGHSAISQQVLDAVLEVAVEPPRRSAPLLSPTEVAVLRLIAEAKSIYVIASLRGISQKTVRNHLARIYRKLGVRSRTEAMLAAIRLGVLES